MSAMFPPGHDLELDKLIDDYCGGTAWPQTESITIFASRIVIKRGLEDNDSGFDVQDWGRTNADADNRVIFNAMADARYRLRYLMICVMNHKTLSSITTLDGLAPIMPDGCEFDTVISQNGIHMKYVRDVVAVVTSDGVCWRYTAAGRLEPYCQYGSAPT